MLMEPQFDCIAFFIRKVMLAAIEAGLHWIRVGSDAEANMAQSKSAGKLRAQVNLCLN